MGPEVSYRISYLRLNVASAEFGSMLLVLVLENVNGSGKNGLQTLSDLSYNYVPEDPAQVGTEYTYGHLQPTSVYKGDKLTSKHQNSGT